MKSEDLTEKFKEFEKKRSEDLDFARKTGYCPEHRNKELEPRQPICNGLQPYVCPECGYSVERPAIDRPKDIIMQEKIKSRANYSLAILGKGAVTRASGRFLNIR